MYRVLLFILLFILNFSFSLIAQNTEAIAVYELEARGVSPIESSIITDRLRSELIKTDRFVVMEREMMEEILEEQAVQLTGVCSNTSCLVELGKLIAVQQMVGGSIGKIGSLFTLQVRLVDVKTGEVLKTVEEDYQGSIEMMLTSITPRVARKLAGLPAEDPFKTGLGNSDLFIESNPSNAIIYLNDQPTGRTTPTTMVGLIAGTYKVYLKKDNYVVQQSVSLMDGELKKISCELSEAKGQIRVITSPAGADVYYGSTLIGKSPVDFEINLKFTPTNIIIQKEGFLTEKVLPEYNERFEFRINKILRHSGTIQFFSDPAGAEVILNNEKVGKTPYTNHQLPLGRHKARIIMNQYEEIDYEFELSQDQRIIKKAFRLNKKLAILNINGYPPGARIFIDGKSYGVLPLNNAHIDFGPHQLIIEKDGFYQYDNQINIKYDDISIDKFSLQPKKRGLATFYSAVLPGAGQFYSGYKTKGLLLGSATIASAAAAVISYKMFKDSKEKYLADKEAYENNTILDQMDELKSQAQNSYDEMESNQQFNNISIGLTLAFWIYNIIDANVFFPDQKSISLTINQESQTTEICVSLKF